MNPEYEGKTPHEIAIYLLVHSQCRLDYTWKTISDTAQDVEAVIDLLKNGQLPRDFLTDGST